MRSFLWIGLFAMFGMNAIASAQDTEATSAPTAEPAEGGDLAEATRLIQSSSREDIQRGLELAGVLGGPQASSVIVARLRQGLPAPLVLSAIDALVALQSSAGPSATPAPGRTRSRGRGAQRAQSSEVSSLLFELCTHRRPEVRIKTIEALLAVRPDGASAALESALSDSHPRVRAAAAIGLGELGDRERLEKLYLALDRGVLEAAQAIGKLTDGEGVDRLMAYIGRVPFAAMAAGLNEVLARRDMPERKKLDVVAKMQELATGESRALLEELVAALPAADRGALKRAAQDAIARIADGEEEGQ